MDGYGIKHSDKEFVRIYKDFLREQGAPSILRRDNAPAQVSEAVYEINREFVVKDQYSEPHNQHQNPVEGGAIKWLKGAVHGLLDFTGAPDQAWYFAAKYLMDVPESATISR